ASLPDQGQQWGMTEDFLGEETAPVLALLLGMVQLEQQAFQDLPLAGGPLPKRAQLFPSLWPAGQAGALLEPHAMIAQIRQQAVARLGGAFHRFAMRMKPIPPFL